MCITNQSWNHFDPIEEEADDVELAKCASQLPPVKQPTQWFGSRPGPSFSLNQTDPE